MNRQYGIERRPYPERPPLPPQPLPEFHNLKQAVWGSYIHSNRQLSDWEAYLRLMKPVRVMEAQARVTQLIRSAYAKSGLRSVNDLSGEADCGL